MKATYTFNCWYVNTQTTMYMCIHACIYNIGTHIHTFIHAYTFVLTHSPHFWSFLSKWVKLCCNRNLGRMLPFNIVEVYTTMLLFWPIANILSLIIFAYSVGTLYKFNRKNISVQNYWSRGVFRRCFLGSLIRTPKTCSVYRNNDRNGEQIQIFISKQS